DGPERPESIDAIADQHLRCGGAGGDADRMFAGNPLDLQFGAVSDEVARDTSLRADLAQAVRIRAIACANDEDQVHHRRKLAQCGLPVLRGVTDIADLRADDILEPSLDGLDRGAGVVHAQCRLRDIGDRRFTSDREPLHIVSGLDEMDLTVELPHRALDFRMAGMTDEDDNASLVDVALPFEMYSSDQRADRVENRQSPRIGIVLDSARDTVRTENRHRTRRDFGQVLDKARALSLKAFDDVPVMHDLVAHVDGRAEFFERAFHNFDGSDNPGAESPRLRQNDFHQPNRFETPFPRPTASLAGEWAMQSRRFFVT